MNKTAAPAAADLIDVLNKKFNPDGSMSSVLKSGLKAVKADFNKMVKDLAKDTETERIPAPEVETSVTNTDGAVMRFVVTLTDVSLAMSSRMVRREAKVGADLARSLGFKILRGDVDEARAARYLANEAEGAVASSITEDRTTKTIRVTTTVMFHHPEDKLCQGLLLPF